jgi:hypothetical protein
MNHLTLPAIASGLAVKKNTIFGMTAVLQTTRTDVNIVGTPECFVVMRRLSLCNFHKMSTFSAAQN